jgi:uncharacterized spore protein YtfJ
MSAVLTKVVKVNVLVGQVVVVRGQLLIHPCVIVGPLLIGPVGGNVKGVKLAKGTVDGLVSGGVEVRHVTILVRKDTSAQPLSQHMDMLLVGNFWRRKLPVGNLASSSEVDTPLV